MKKSMIGLFVFLAAKSLSAQSVWVVDQLNGPGANFTSLQPAVDAAAPGDVIRVRSGDYVAPTIIGKGLRIVGELGPTQNRPRVDGAWYIQGVPQGQELVIFRLEQFGTFTHGWEDLVVTACSGSVVLDDLVCDPVYTYPSAPLYAFATVGTRFVDCRLVCVQHCNIVGYGHWQCLRSTMIITDSILRAENVLGQEWGGRALTAAGSKITIMGSSLYGASATSAARYNHASPAITYEGTDFWMGGGSRIEGGHWYGSSNSYIDLMFSDPWFQTWGIPGGGVPNHSLVSVDLSATTIPSSVVSDASVTYLYPSLTAISQTQTASTLRVSQRCHAPSLTVLAIGDLAPQPWSNIVDRVFLDPATASIYFDVAPSASPLVRTFPIPPGLPPGLTVALQGFELPTTGAVSSSNVTFAGIW